MKKILNSKYNDKLSKRQCQILELLKAGKVNKEVACELNIGLGTVKQHVVALFKKLKVTNRTMAVSKAKIFNTDNELNDETILVSGNFEYRPCIILSILFSEEIQNVTCRFVNEYISVFSTENDSILLSKTGKQKDIIIGINKINVHDLVLLIQFVCKIYNYLVGKNIENKKKLRCCIVAGMSVVSVKRFGGWTGEAIASSSIALSRNILQNTPDGFISFNKNALYLMKIFGFDGHIDLPMTLSLENINNVKWLGVSHPYPFLGRDQELKILKSYLKKRVHGHVELISIVGEMGMGKSCLCEEILAHYLKKGGKGRVIRCFPSTCQYQAYDDFEKSYRTFDEIICLIVGVSRVCGELIIIDDVNCLDDNKQRKLVNAALSVMVSSNNKTVIFSGRNSVLHCEDYRMVNINLKRLPDEPMKKLIRKVLVLHGFKQKIKTIQNVASLSAGVPFFAIELAKNCESTSIPLSLQIMVSARLDTLPLDRILLRTVAKSNSITTTVEDIACSMGEDLMSVQSQIEKTIACGVLRRDSNGRISFNHPLLRQAILSMIME